MGHANNWTALEVAEHYLGSEISNPAEITNIDALKSPHRYS